MEITIATYESLDTIEEYERQQTKKQQEHQMFGATSGDSVYSVGSFSASAVSVPSGRQIVNGMTVEEYNRREAVAFIATLRRQGGLQSIGLQSTPMTTRVNPYNTRAGTSSGRVQGGSNVNASVGSSVKLLRHK